MKGYYSFWDYFNTLAGATTRACVRDDGNNDRQCYGLRGDLESCLDALTSKRAALRKEALQAIHSSLEESHELPFAENQCYTLLHQCRTFVKKGSKEEANLAVRVAGLLAVTVSCSEVDTADEIYEDSVSMISEALCSRSSKLDVAELLNCLAIITFFGAEIPEQTEALMQIIWQFMHQESSSHVNEQKVATAMIAWSFLLSTLDGWSIRRTLWREGVTFILDKLQSAKEESQQVSACIALCHILEVGCIKKFLEEDEFSADGSVEERVAKLKEHIRNHVKELTCRGRNSKDICNHILYFIEKGHLDIAVQVDGCMNTMPTLSHMIQRAFLANFLGRGFQKHMQGNQVLRAALELPQAGKHDLKSEPMETLATVPLLEDTYYAPDEVMVLCKIPTVEEELNADSEKKRKVLERLYYKSPNSVYRKAMTHLRNKQRTVSLQEKLRIYEDNAIKV